MKKFSFFMVLLTFFLALNNGAFGMISAIAADLPAFPGAVGFGSTTNGGRGGRVIEVTNLNDSGPGSFRKACEALGPRIIVFRTGGTIKISSNIKIRNPYVTIAGQSAPGYGICIRGAAITIATHNVIMRGLYVRVGDASDGPNPEDRDAIQIQNNLTNNVIIDHCSASWAVDENITIWDAGIHDVTISNCIISEALYDSIHPKGLHSKGSLVGQGIKNISYIGNLFAHNDERNPRVRFTSGVIVNNVNYNRRWKDLDIDSSIEAQQISVVGNYYIKGSNNHLNNKPIFINDAIKSGSQIYISDNECSSYTGVPCYECRTTEFNPIVKFAPVWPSGLVAKPSGEVLEWVLANAGARPLDRDSTDARIIADVKNGTGYLVDSQDKVGGWPDLRSGTPPQDTDHDGMPDLWEKARGLNPNDSEDGNADQNGDGYTNVEEYLNELISTDADFGSRTELSAPTNLRFR